jgi:two-component system, OmpR family, sensor kinase
MTPMTRPKLRIQVLAGVLAVTLVALAAFDVIAVTALHRYLIGQSGQRLQAALTVAQPKVNVIIRTERTTPVPGAYTIVLVPQGKTKRPVVLEYGQAALAQIRPPVVQVAAGHQKQKPVTAGKRPSGPVATMVRAAVAARPTAVTVGIEEGVQIASVRVAAGTLVAGTSLSGVNATVSRFRLIVIAGSAAAGLLICAGVVLVIRRAAALNSMLTSVEASVAERDATAAAMRRFFSDASHELRTPLASLRANAELYQQGALPRRPQVDEAMRRIALEAQRMSRLVDDMMHLARLDQLAEPDHEPVDLRELVNDAVEDARHADPLRVYRADADGDLTTHGDRELLRRALDNLLANVRTHTPPGTTASVSVLGTDDGVTIEVSDDGPGVPEDELPRVFDRFYRANAPVRRPGSGLGLAIVAEIAAAHGGTARASATDPRGLSVAVTVRAPARQLQ